VEGFLLGTEKIFGSPGLDAVIRENDTAIILIDAKTEVFDTVNVESGCGFPLIECKHHLQNQKRMAYLDRASSYSPTHKYS
jgi:hypothetical protein